MCGIFGLRTTRAGAIPDGALARALAALEHRGPNDRGVFEHDTPDSRCGLAHTRLAIIDLSPTGHQPMSTDDGRLTLTYNGEVYNHAELRR
jgi:asparagine synthase (glutamine-hydrolysing)